MEIKKVTFQSPFELANFLAETGGVFTRFISAHVTAHEREWDSPSNLRTLQQFLKEYIFKSKTYRCWGQIVPDCGFVRYRNPDGYVTIQGNTITVNVDNIHYRMATNGKFGIVKED